MSKPGGIDAGSVLVSYVQARAIIAGAVSGQVRVTLRNNGGPAIRVGPDNTVAFLSPPGSINVGSTADSGFLIAPGEERSVEQPGSLAVYAIAQPGAGGTNDGVVGLAIVDYLVEVLAP